MRARALPCLLSVLVSIAAVFVSRAAVGGEGASSPQREPVGASRSVHEFGSGNVDLSFSFGVGRRLRLEPGLTIGVVEFDDLATFSLGIGTEVGYGLLCTPERTLLEGCVRRVVDIVPKARGAFHTSALGTALRAPIDAYVGASLGPALYLYRARALPVSGRTVALTAVSQVFLGIRFFVRDWGGFFGFAEIRYQNEYGDHEVEIDHVGGRPAERLGGDYHPPGLKSALGVGVRF